MKAKEHGKKAIRIVNNTVNFLVLIFIVLAVAFAGYALWDSKQISRAADKSNYEIYKPTAEDGRKSFEELQAINPEVMAWLTIYGTNIDYPVTQGLDNMKYVNTNAEGRYSLSGSIFLDESNDKEFRDFNSILYGHHMEKDAMFGGIGNFSDSDMFDSHRYGNLYFSGKDHGIEFFAFIHTDAYNRSVFKPNVKESDRKSYLDGLFGQAMHKRDIGVTTEDHIVLLTTCSPSSTNGRDVLVGKISKETYENLFADSKPGGKREQLHADSQNGLQGGIPRMLIASALFIAILLAVLILINKRRRKSNGENEETKAV